MTKAFEFPVTQNSISATFTGWRSLAPRKEICPHFAYDTNGGKDGQGTLIIDADEREGLDGWWNKAFPVTGGGYYHFHLLYRAESVKAPRRSVVIKIDWFDAEGKAVPEDQPTCTGYLPGYKSMAETEHPKAKETDSEGWTEVSHTYYVPSQATQASVELHLQWSPNSRIEWSLASLTQTVPPPKRTVRLATVHFQPHGGESPDGNCRLFEPFIAEAAKRRADLVVLGETLTLYGTGKTYADVAEPIPGPSTEYFGALAKQHDLYIVAGLVERVGHLIYNTAVLMGPDGEVVGRYRKMCLPRTEVQSGVAPGSEYPVFDTRFGKVGMMICYDGFFPEVALELTRKGAEVIAWPVWGCNPLLASARACENHVYVVSSTYEDISRNWALSAVYNHEGKTIALATEWGTVAVAEVDLEEPTRWLCLGDFKAHLHRHRPLAPDEL
ncbi:MAG: carbon-nitrogen hydrolase family protein [Armatimonadetes bacterium]|nr:carbon-nitrogen hydrolase family protein [Armatimonadota bacterium]